MKKNFVAHAKFFLRHWVNNDNMDNSEAQKATLTLVECQNL